MTINEVYAINIQSRQIVERIKCKPNDYDTIEKERGNFLKWLNKSDRVFNNQLDAWNFYDSQNVNDVYDENDYQEILDSVQNYMDRELEDVELEAWTKQKEPDWVTRQKYILFKQAEMIQGGASYDADNPYYSPIHGYN